MRNFVTINSGDSNGKIVDEQATCRTMYVAEVCENAKATDVDEDDVECSETEANRTVVSDLYVPLFCCRGPARKLPPVSAIEALRNAAAKGREALHVGDVVRLNGVETTI